MWKTMIRAGLHQHKGSFFGIGGLLSLVFLTLLLSVTVAVHSQQTITQELNRLGYGDVTAWVNDTQDIAALAAQISGLPEVSQVDVQPLVYAAYSAHGYRSDNEGQLLAYQPKDKPYLLLDADWHESSAIMEDHQVWISPALRASMQLEIGDEIEFLLGRSEEVLTLQVGGYFEDPFMGSSMIDMKSFLVSPRVYDQVLAQLAELSEFDQLARPGAMLHVFKQPDSSLSTAAFTQAVNAQTTLSQSTEFLYSQAAIAGFMLLLQNIFIGFLSAFALVLTGVSLIVIAHFLTSAIRQDQKDIAVLKTMGLTGRQLQRLWTAEIAIVTAVSALLAGLVTPGISRIVHWMTMTSTAIRIPSAFPLGWGGGAEPGGEPTGHRICAIQNPSASRRAANSGDRGCSAAHNFRVCCNSCAEGARSAAAAGAAKSDHAWYPGPGLDVGQLAAGVLYQPHGQAAELAGTTGGRADGCLQCGGS